MAKVQEAEVMEAAMKAIEAAVVENAELKAAAAARATMAAYETQQ